MSGYKYVMNKQLDPQIAAAKDQFYDGTSDTGLEWRDQSLQDRDRAWLGQLLARAGGYGAGGPYDRRQGNTVLNRDAQTANRADLAGTFQRQLKVRKYLYRKLVSKHLGLPYDSSIVIHLADRLLQGGQDPQNWTPEWDNIMSQDGSVD